MRKPRNTNPFGKPHWKPKNVKLTNTLRVKQGSISAPRDVALEQGRRAPDAMEVSRAAHARIAGLELRAAA